MHPDSQDPNAPAADALPPSLLAALRALPSENCGPTQETDAAILASSQKILADLRNRRFHRRLWPALAAAACAALAFALFSQPRSTPASQAKTKPEDKYALILREVSVVFPGQIKAIFANGSDLQIELADKPLTGNEQAVVIEICEQQTCKVVITYVGQTLKIGEHLISVSSDSDGSLVIDSPDFDNSHARPSIKTRRI